MRSPPSRGGGWLLSAGAVWAVVVAAMSLAGSGGNPALAALIFLPANMVSSLVIFLPQLRRTFRTGLRGNWTLPGEGGYARLSPLHMVVAAAGWYPVFAAYEHIGAGAGAALFETWVVFFAVLYALRRPDKRLGLSGAGALSLAVGGAVLAGVAGGGWGFGGLEGLAWGLGGGAATGWAVERSLCWGEGMAARTGGDAAALSHLGQTAARFPFLCALILLFPLLDSGRPLAGAVAPPWALLALAGILDPVGGYLFRRGNMVITLLGRNAPVAAASLAAMGLLAAVGELGAQNGGLLAGGAAALALGQLWAAKGGDPLRGGRGEGGG